MNEAQPDMAAEDGAADAADSAVAAVLEQLWMARQENPGKLWSLAKLAKRVQLPMSTLRRTLTLLKAADLVDFHVDEEGRGHADLTEQGGELCAMVRAQEEGAALAC